MGPRLTRQAPAPDASTEAACLISSPGRARRDAAAPPDPSADTEGPYGPITIDAGSAVNITLNGSSTCGHYSALTCS